MQFSSYFVSIDINIPLQGVVIDLELFNTAAASWLLFWFHYLCYLVLLASLLSQGSPLCINSFNLMTITTKCRGSTECVNESWCVGNINASLDVLAESNCIIHCSDGKRWSSSFFKFTFSFHFVSSYCLIERKTIHTGHKNLFIVPSLKGKDDISKTDEFLEKFQKGGPWPRIEDHEDIFVFDHILHFSEYTRVQLG